nr:MAG TPA: hypothetical protein [Caudoviricetes sp.]
MITLTEAILSKSKLSNEDLIVWSNYVKPYKEEDYDLSIKGNKLYISTFTNHAPYIYLYMEELLNDFDIKEIIIKKDSYVNQLNIKSGSLDGLTLTNEKKDRTVEVLNIGFPTTLNGYISFNEYIRWDNGRYLVKELQEYKGAVSVSNVSGLSLPRNLTSIIEEKDSKVPEKKMLYLSRQTGRSTGEYLYFIKGVSQEEIADYWYTLGGRDIKHFDPKLFKKNSKDKNYWTYFVKR